MGQDNTQMDSTSARKRERVCECVCVCVCVSKMKMKRKSQIDERASGDSVDILFDTWSHCLFKSQALSDVRWLPLATPSTFSMGMILK